MKKYRIPFLWGVVLFAATMYIALIGYAYVIMYIWPVILFGILFFVAGYVCSKGKGFFSLYITTFMIVTVSAITGLGLGTGIQTYIKSKICDDCDLIVEALDRYKQKNGSYPKTLDTGKLGISANIRFIYNGDWDGGGINVMGNNDYDATIYLSAEKYFCIIPVTKVLIMSTTRFYVFKKSSWKPDWKYDHIIWMLDSIRK